MPVIYRVKNPQEEGDIVKTLLKSDVLNGTEKKEKMHLRSNSLNAALQAFHLSASTQLSILLPIYYSTMFYKVTARSIPARGCAPISTSSFFVLKILQLFHA